MVENWKSLVNSRFYIDLTSIPGSHAIVVSRPISTEPTSDATSNVLVSSICPRNRHLNCPDSLYQELENILIETKFLHTPVLIRTR